MRLQKDAKDASTNTVLYDENERAKMCVYVCLSDCVYVVYVY